MKENMTQNESLTAQGQQNNEMQMILQNNEAESQAQESIEEPQAQEAIEEPQAQETTNVIQAQEATNGLQAQEPEAELLPVEAFLADGYELRFNELSKKTEFREKREGSVFRPLTKQALNSLYLLASKALHQEKGLRAMLTAAIYSERTVTWNPATAWLNSLPEWDGRNRVDYLFNLLPGSTAEQRYWLTVWLRSVVAHWLQMDSLHANECVPTLIGDQGCGKSTFFLRLLPEHLREYFLDHVNLRNKFDKEMALTNNLLVNIDELDQVRPAQQAELKQMLSKVRVNGRMIYGSEQTDRTRFASFVATTNNRHPLQDHTGSRRFICIELTRGKLIDNTLDIDYEQFYAQVLHELHAGERYWFTQEEVLAIQRANMSYHATFDLEVMVTTCFRQPRPDEFVRPLTLTELISLIAKQYPLIPQTHSTKIQLGFALRALGFQRKEGHDGMAYYAVAVES